MSKMKEIRIEKITMNIGSGKDTGRLEKAMKLLEMLTSMKPVKTFSKKRIPAWGLRPGMPIGCKVTVRRGADELLKRLLDAVEFKLDGKQFDDYGTFSFGIHEYIDVGGLEYDPEIGIMGLQVCVTLERRGYRIKRRKMLKTTPGKKHIIKKQDALEFIQSNFKVRVEA
ncbi:MAG: 50S ribosomal protein L5 [Nanoarchaeota archaeon]|nr:50S ribosomal protein L5 [Nanoarchaeota archaeon]